MNSHVTLNQQMAIMVGNPCAVFQTLSNMACVQVQPCVIALLDSDLA